MKKGFLIGFILSAIFLYLAFRKVNLEDLKMAFSQAEYIYLIPVILLALFSQWLRSYRWGLILKPVKKLDQWTLFSLTSVGYMAIVVLPVRLGEFARPYLLNRKYGLGLSSALATITIERVFDGLTLMIVLAFVIATVPLPKWVASAGIIMLTVFFSLFVLLLSLAIKRDYSTKVINGVFSKFPHRISERMIHLLTSFVEGLEILPSIRKNVLVAFLSVTLWINVGFIIYLLFLSFKFDLPLIAAYTVLTITTLGVMLPAAPGFVGNFHIFVIIALTLFKIPKSEALTFAIMLHFISVGLVILLGLIFLPHNAISLSKIYQIKQVVTHTK